MLRKDTETSPFSVLYPDIIEFSRRDEVLLLGDFNAMIGTQQTSLLDFHSDPVLLHEVDIEDSGFPHSFVDTHAPTTTYGRALSDLGCIHDMVIYNGIARWPASNSFTCFPHEGGASVVDYII